MLPRNLKKCFASLLVEPIAGKNVSPSNEKLWQFLKNYLVAEKSQCKALSNFVFADVSRKKTEKLIFISLKLCFLGFVHRHNKLFFSYLWSFVHIFTSSSMNPS